MGRFGYIDLAAIDDALEPYIDDRPFQTEPKTAVVPPSTEVTASEEWWELYFTTPGGETNHISSKLVDYINSTEETIHIASYEFNLDEVADALIAAYNRGVEVQFMTDDERGIELDEEEGHGQFASLVKAGIEVRDDERSGKMHDKFWIFDGKVVWTGSTNITINGTTKNNNNVIIFNSALIAEIYEREFQEMWTDGKFGITSPSTVALQKVVINETPITVLFGAEDEVGIGLAELLATAETSIRFMAFSFTDDDMGGTMLTKFQSGVEVIGIFEKTGSETEFSEMTFLYCADVPVRQDGNKQAFHHKVLIIDKHIVVTGSFNFSESADKKNDENLVIIDSAEIAEEYLKEFERRWAEAQVVDPADILCK
jgi:phosphatidylserine/phosphatidylglycerophosphate/cardiolipin synthase-like enzyme